MARRRFAGSQRGFRAKMGVVFEGIQVFEVFEESSRRWRHPPGAWGEGDVGHGTAQQMHSAELPRRRRHCANIARRSGEPIGGSVRGTPRQDLQEFESRTDTQREMEGRLGAHDMAIGEMPQQVADIKHTTRGTEVRREIALAEVRAPAPPPPQAGGG